jgi:hypothetical protein
MKERLKLISRLLRTSAINDDEAAILIEPIKEYIYWGGYRWYDSRPYYGDINYSSGTITCSTDKTSTNGAINNQSMSTSDILGMLKTVEF